MEQPIVISATIILAEYFCREILGINPRKHAMSARTAARHGLVGMHNPVVIVYCSYEPIWNIEDQVKMYENLTLSQATVIEMPEVTRISRPIRFG